MRVLNIASAYFFVNKRHVKYKMCAYNIEVLKDDNAEEKNVFPLIYIFLGKYRCFNENFIEHQIHVIKN